MTTHPAQLVHSPRFPGPVELGRRVVVGVDGDPAGLAALRFAATEAAHRGGDVLAVHVWHHPTSWGISATTWGYAGIRLPDGEPARHILAALQASVELVLAERAAAGQPVVAITAEVVEGVDARTLRATARGAALLVLGARHHARLLGSVSHAVLAGAPCPVAVVPPPHDPPELDTAAPRGPRGASRPRSPLGRAADSLPEAATAHPAGRRHAGAATVDTRTSFLSQTR